MSGMSNKLAGEFRYEIHKKDGTVVKTTDFQKNLVLDGGLSVMGMAHYDSGNGWRDTWFHWQQKCVVGTGNSQPVITQVALDAQVGEVALNQNTYDYAYVDDGSGYYKVSRTCRYDFEGLGVVNIAEIGLKCQSVLCTRALLRDSFGAQTTISLLADEILVVYYKVTAYHSTADTVSLVDLVDKNGNREPYKITMRIASVGEARVYQSTVASGYQIYTGSYGVVYADAAIYTTGELQPITTSPAQMSNKPNLLKYIRYESSDFGTYFKLKGYSAGSYKRYVELDVGIQHLNGDIGYVIFSFRNGFAFQAKIERVSDGAPITKTDKHKLRIPFYISWARHEEV